MLRLTNNRKAITLGAEVLNVNYLNIRHLRPRKPSWLPTAKSKLFKIPPRPVIPEDEQEELKRLYNNYRTQMKSLQSYLISRYEESGTEVSNQEEQQKSFEDDFARCYEINNKWNESVKVQREEFFESQLLKEIEIAEQRINVRAEVHKAKREKAENIVRTQKEQAKNFISPENIDAAIEYALANPVDYNFAIDLDGNRYYGRNTKPEVEKTPKDKIYVKQ